jgi:adenylate cyclase
MPQSRQLVSIMFTDIVGYTALMGSDEHKALELLSKNRQIQQPIIDQFGGKWIKELGDGVLASFTTVADAVNAAINIQERCNKENQYQLRIGIHLGDVIFENEDVFGDGVNIAARIQSIANPGCIYVSESVHQNIGNKTEIASRFIKEEMLKNVKEAVRIYEIMTSASQELATSPVKTVAQTIPEKSIAVLPFVNMSSDPEQEYFSDGMAEEILNALSHLKDLKVAGRTSSFQFKGKNIDLREVGQKLGVRTVLEGSVRRHANRLRITVQLINVQDGYHIWSEKFDRNMDDIFATQDEIALAITEQLKLTILGPELELITKVSTRNTKAYELYLKGKFFINRRGNYILQGLDLLKQAIAVDPNYALAYCGYAFAKYLTAVYNYSSGVDVMGEVKQAIDHALRLDESLAEAYFMQGMYHSAFGWNWVEVKKNFNKAIALNENYATVRSLYAMIYLAQVEGNFDEAERQALVAIHLEPLSAIDHGDMSFTLYTAGRFEEALAYAKTGIEIDANSFLANRFMALCYMSLGRHQEAINSLEHLVGISNRHQHALHSLIWAYCKDKRFSEARMLMDELHERSSTEYIAGTYMGISAAYLGDMDTAFECLDKALDDFDPSAPILKYVPFVPNSLRNDKRFQVLLDRIGYPKE